MLEAMTLPYLTIFLGYISETISDLSLAIKIFVLLTIIYFVRNHLGGGLISTIVILIFAYFVIFAKWHLFGPLYIIYIIMVLGVGGIFMDFFFLKQQSMGMEGGGPPPGRDASTLKTTSFIGRRMGR